MNTHLVRLFALALMGCAGSSVVQDGQPSSIASAVASSTAMPPVPTASASAVIAPPNPIAVARVAVDSKQTMARLPKNAAVVGWVRPASADWFIDWSTRAKEIRADVQKDLGWDGAASMLADLGVEPGAAVAFGVVGPDRAQAEKLIAEISKAKDYDQVLMAHRKAPPNGTFFRFVARKKADVDELAQLEKNAKRLNLKVARCPGPNTCKGLGDARAVVTHYEWMGALYSEGDRLELDLVRAADDAERQAQLLAARQKEPRGAPEGRCTLLSQDADLSLCIDGDRAGELGAATGMLMTLSAVAGRSIDQKDRAMIAAQGKKESMRNIELASPKRRLLDDGTVNVTLDARGFEARGSWAYAKETRPSATKPESDLCSPLDGVVKTLVPDLMGRLGDLGDDFKKPKERVDHLREAGWGAAVVLLGRTWPNFLGAMKDGALRLRKLPVTKVCRVIAGDRLELKIEGTPIPFLDDELGDRPGPGEGKASAGQ
ncbi:MAG: hypothetical protein JNK04_09170 [Myxococcales bacterium]|nr:hypothetical protein [Myxococcales bacterium]